LPLHDALPISDALRPLDAAGRAEAVRLAGLLHAYGHARLISSATARCLETVLPYARRTGASIETDPAFTVGETAAGQARDRLLALRSEERRVGKECRSRWAAGR